MNENIIRNDIEMIVHTHFCGVEYEFSVDQKRKSVILTVNKFGDTTSDELYKKVRYHLSHAVRLEVRGSEKEITLDRAVLITQKITLLAKLAGLSAPCMSLEGTHRRRIQLSFGRPFGDHLEVYVSAVLLHEDEPRVVSSLTFSTKASRASKSRMKFKALHELIGTTDFKSIGV